MNERYDYAPVALYARVSSDRQDVDLSVAAQLRALRDYAAKNGYFVAREYVDEAESGRVADRPEFRKMIDEASKPQAPFREILVWKFSRFTRKREHAVAFKSMLRRKGVRVVSITEHADDSPTGKLMEAIIESVDEFYSENLATEVLRGMREAASRGFWVSSHAPFGYNRIMVQDGPKKRPTWRSTRIRPASSGASSTWPRPPRAPWKSPASSTTRASPVPGGSYGARPASTASSPTRLTPALWYGVKAPRTRASRCGLTRPFPPSSPRPSSAGSTSSCAPAPPSSAIPAGSEAPTCSAAWPSARRATRPSPDASPRAASTPTTSARPTSRSASTPARLPRSTPAASRNWWSTGFAPTSSPRTASATW